jgi:hypothetical protein
LPMRVRRWGGARRAHFWCCLHRLTGIHEHYFDLLCQGRFHVIWPILSALVLERLFLLPPPDNYKWKRQKRFRAPRALFESCRCRRQHHHVRGACLWLSTLDSRKGVTHQRERSIAKKRLQQTSVFIGFRRDKLA